MNNVPFLCVDQIDIFMIIYNVTVKIEAAIHEEWLKWMKEVHIPDVMATQCFERYQICKLLHQEEDGGMTFAFQYSCKTMQDLQHYNINYAARLQKEHTERYKNRYVAFRTLMEVVE